MRPAMAGLLVILGACGGVATRPMQFVAEPLPAAQAGSGACLVNVRAIEDKRDSASSFGSSGNFEQFAKNVPDWVKTAVQSLDVPGRKVVVADAGAATDALNVTVRIHRAYVHGLATTRTSQIVLSGEYERAGKVLATQFYRGSDTSVNWSSSPDEVEGGMNAAMNLARAAMSRDFDRYCASVPGKN
jgi:hypothetical protein